MSRIIWALAVVAGGAAANAGIAIWLAVRAPVSLTQTGAASTVLHSGERVPFLHFAGQGSDLLKWHFHLIRGDPDKQKYPTVRAPWWSDVARREFYNAPDAPFFVNVRCELAAGWPIRSMRWCYKVKDPPGTNIFEPSWAGIRLTDHASVSSWHLARFRAVPVLPAWRGFVANTSLYAAALATSVLGARWLRCWWRRRRGRCGYCGYPAGVADVCTECGRPLPAFRSPDGLGMLLL